MSAENIFNKNELKILRFFVDDLEEFRFYQKEKQFFLKIKKTFSQIQSYTKLSLIKSQEEDTEKLYIIFNLTTDNNLQVNLPKSLVYGDKTFDIIQPHLSVDKNIKKILVLIKDKRLFKNLDSITNNEAKILTKDSKSIFPKTETDEKKEEKKQEVEEIKKDESTDNNTNNVELYFQAVSEINELLRSQLGMLANLFDKKVFVKVSKQVIKTLLVSIIKTTLQVSDINDDAVLSECLQSCKNLGLFSPRSIKKGCSRTNGYLLFMKENKDNIKNEHNLKGIIEINKVVSNKWSKLSENEKEVYRSRSKKR